MSTRRYWQASLVPVVSLALALGNLGAAVAAPEQGAIPPSAQVQGKSYGEWLALAWQKIIAQPPSSPSGCIVGSSGNVLLLNGPGDGTPMSCEVPAGKIIDVGMVSAECSTVEAPPWYGADAAGLLTCLSHFTYTDLSVTVDGAQVPDIDAYRVTSPVYPIEFPDPNILGVNGPGTGYSLAGGALVMLTPLTPGAHRVVTWGTLNQDGTPIATYNQVFNIVVTP